MYEHTQLFLKQKKKKLICFNHRAFPVYLVICIFEPMIPFSTHVAMLLPITNEVRELLCMSV